MTAGWRPAGDARTRLVGIAFGIAASAGLGLAVGIARIAFDGGTNGLSVSFARTWFAAGLMAAMALAVGQRLALPRDMRWPIVCLGLLFAMMNYGNIGATRYIPVSVAALLFFVYPPLVGVLNAILDRRPPGLLKMVALLVAFAGLAVMLGVEFRGLDGRGVAIGLLAGTACAVNIVWVSRRARHVNSFVLVMWMSLVAALSLSLLNLFSGQFALPVTGIGWLAAGAVVLLQSASMPLYYGSITRIGAERGAMLNNLQPVTSIAAAIALYAEAVTPERVGGAAMVIGGILLMQWSDARDRRLSGA